MSFKLIRTWSYSKPKSCFSYIHTQQLSRLYTIWRGDSTNPGLWTLDWTMDWTLDSI